MNDNRIIKVLTSESLIRFGDWINDKDGHLNPVFIGEFRHPDGDITAYCKLYDERKKGIINEIIGFLAAYALGISQPQHAFIAMLPSARLPGFAKTAKSREGNLWMQGKSNVLCFCTSRLDGYSAAIHLNRPIDSGWNELCEDIARWQEYGAAVALDENIAHTDRHANNLLRLGRQQYALIDNGRLVNGGDEQWDCTMLDAGRLYDNRLFSLLKHRSGGSPSNGEIGSKAVLCAEQHPHKLKSIEEELLFWLNTFLVEPEGQTFRQFLTDRTKGLPCLLKHRFSLMI